MWRAVAALSEWRRRRQLCTHVSGININVHDVIVVFGRAAKIREERMIVRNVEEEFNESSFIRFVHMWA